MAQAADAAAVGKQTKATLDKREHAVVIGGSMTGLCAARVLTEHYARVTIVERDDLLHVAGVRSGVPQARHGHVLLMEGRLLLERLFPGFTDEMLHAGALLLDWSKDCWIFNGGNWMPQSPSNVSTLFMSRPLLEDHVRQRVLRLPQVVIETGVVRQLTLDPTRQRVTGVIIGERDTTAADEVISADLVVDASGRDSHMPEWLAALGVDAPARTVVDASVGYASRIYQGAPATTHPWQFLAIRGLTPQDLRAGTIIPMEQGRWMVTLSGSGGDYPPTDEAGFLAFAESLAQPTLYEAIKHAEPLSRVYGYRRTENSIRHYERLKHQPAGLVVLGDAACVFNPVYGQGMTSSVIAATTLDQTLRQYRRKQPPSGKTFERAFQQRLARRNAACWTIATSDDYRVPNVQGSPAPWTMRLAHKYLDAVVQQNARSQFTYDVFNRVIHLMQSPLALFHPVIVGRMLANKIKPKQRTTKQE